MPDVVNTLRFDGSTADFTQAFDCSNANYLLVGVISNATAGSEAVVEGMTFNGDALTQHVSATHPFSIDTARDIHLKWFGLSNPDQGEYDIAIDLTFPSAPATGAQHYIAIALSNVYTSNPVAGTDHDGQDADDFPNPDLSITKTLPGPSIGFMYGTIRPNAAGANYVTASGTEIFDNQTVIGDNNGGKYCSYRKFQSAGTHALTATGSYDLAPAPDAHAEIGILLNGIPFAAQTITFD